MARSLGAGFVVRRKTISSDERAKRIAEDARWAAEVTEEIEGDMNV